jgi:hypothetical protein
MKSAVMRGDQTILIISQDLPKEMYKVKMDDS